MSKKLITRLKKDVAIWKDIAEDMAIEIVAAKNGGVLDFKEVEKFLEQKYNSKNN